MKHLLNYKLFEYKFADVATMSKEFKKKHGIWDGFKDDKVPLIKKIYNINTKTQMKIEWNDTPNHNMKERVKRTTCNSFTDFNHVIRETFKQIIPYEQGKSITKNDKKYAIYLKDHNFTIIAEIDYKAMLTNDTVNIKVITILNGLMNSKNYPLIGVDDSNFNAYVG